MTTTENNNRRTQVLDFITIVLEDLYLYSCSIVLSSSQFIQRFLDHIHLSELLETVSEKLEDYPVLKFAVFGAAASFVFPVLLFILFALVSVILTFTSFVLIEGIILAIGGLCLCACLISMIVVMSGLAVSLGICYMIVMKLQSCKQDIF